MKLNLTTKELELNETTKRYSEKKRIEISEVLANKKPVKIRNIIHQGRWVNLVYPTSLTPLPDKRATLTFKPVWSRAMIGCHIKSSDIRILVVKFDHGQFEFSHKGENPSTATMEGPGCDPSVVAESETKLADILEKYSDNPAVKFCKKHIAMRFA